MRSLISCIMAALLVLACAATGLAKEPGWGRVYTVRGKVTVRENPEQAALTVRVLKSGQKVRVDFEDGGWAAVFDPAETERVETRAQGYVRLAELRSEAKPGARSEAMSEAAPRPEKPDKSGKLQKSAAPDTADKGKKTESRKGAQAQSFGEIRVADRQMAVRAGRDKDTEFKRLLKAGQRARVDFQEDGWFAVFAPDEKVRELSRAWGFGRDKYLVPEKDYTGQPLPEPSEAAAKETLAKPAAAAKEIQAKPAPKQKPGASVSDAVGYTVQSRQADHLRPLAPVVLRVRIDVTAPPAPEALRKIMREIWKAERRKNEDLQVEVLLPSMDQGGLAYGVARFHDDGRIKEFWWREVVLRTKR
ncbi:MAG: hypothetical protein A2051_04790 [Desulfovibrionales bacterium GWA2_65_9]|nr:MAG: hypothetical protein A2051_04790 [Desulfovibrionales bacterium GWA2_65_9]